MTEVFVPYVVNRWFTTVSAWRQTSVLFIQNTGTQAATVSVAFYDSWGAEAPTSPFTVNRNINPKGMAIVYGSEMPLWEGNDAGLAAARITANQPLAVVATTEIGVADYEGPMVTPYLAGNYHAFAWPADKIYLPTIAHAYYLYESTPQVQNTSSSPVEFKITYYPDSNGKLTQPRTFNFTVGAYRAQNLYQAQQGLPVGYLGGAVVEWVSGPHNALVAMAQFDKYDTDKDLYGATQYEGITAETQKYAMPYVKKALPWSYTGIQAQNMSSSSTEITLSFYDAGGGSVEPPATKSDIPPNYSVNFWSEIPSTLDGSAVGSALPALPVGLEVNFDRLGDPLWTDRDGMKGYSAVR